MKRVYLAAAVMILACALLALGFTGCAAHHVGYPGGTVSQGQKLSPDSPAPATAAPSFGVPGGFKRDKIGRMAARQADLPPGSLPSPGEELWVIQKPAREAEATAPRDDEPGTGALMAKRAGNDTPVPVPLKHTDVKASIAGYIASVDVTQQFHNPYDQKIEAIYVFPLPHNAAINEFLMTVGDRRIRGIIREREEAKQIYEEAKSQGYVASLLTQERPNIFTQAVANIEPGRQIDINIRYFHTLSYVDGYYEYVFPMVVGPRFNPPGFSDGVGAVGRGSRGISGQSTEVQYLKPTERSGHDISLSVLIDAGVKIEQIDSRNHKAKVKKIAEQAVEVSIAEEDRIPNKDFVLRYKVAGETVKTALMTHRDEQGGYFTLMIVPPADLKDLPRRPLEMVFTLDVSGSMSGPPIEQSRAAMRYALTRMGPDDTFQIVRFAGAAEQLFTQPQPVTRGNLRRGLHYMEVMQAGGGTMMLEGIRSSLNFPHDESRLRCVAFLTDGYIGNETQILAEIHRSLGPARVFSFGVGSSPNRYLLDHMAKMGAGAVAYLGLNDSAEEVMEQYFQRLSHPALTDIELDFGGMQVSDIYPRRMPDLFVGRPVIITGRYRGEAPVAITMKGRVGDEVRGFSIPLNPADRGDHKALPVVWARMKLADLLDQSAYEPNPELPNQVKQVALEYGLMSPYTAFLAVDSSARTQGAYGVSVTVPVSVPDGVRYDTTVQDAAASEAPKDR